MTMKDKLHHLLLLAVVGVGLFMLFNRLYARPWQQHERRLGEAIQSGILMQMAIAEFDKQTGRHPAYAEFTNVFGFISSFQEGVTPGGTNKVISAFDNSGGWFYDEKSGEVRINRNGRYVIGFQTWVDPAQINFRPPTKVEAVHLGRPKILDYGYFNKRLDSGGPQIAEIVRKWAATNTVTKGSNDSTQTK
jgi:hypothetical protein